jgi:hypothetical protein
VKEVLSRPELQEKFPALTSERVEVRKECSLSTGVDGNSEL